MTIQDLMAIFYSYAGDKGMTAEDAAILAEIETGIEGAENLIKEYLKNAFSTKIVIHSEGGSKALNSLPSVHNLLT